MGLGRVYHSRPCKYKNNGRNYRTDFKLVECLFSIGYSRKARRGNYQSTFIVRRRWGYGEDFQATLCSSLFYTCSC